MFDMLWCPHSGSTCFPPELPRRSSGRRVIHVWVQQVALQRWDVHGHCVETSKTNLSQLPLLIWTSSVSPQVELCGRHADFRWRHLFCEERARFCSQMANRERNKKLLLELMKQPENKRCADCGASGESSVPCLSLLMLVFKI